MSTRAQKVHRLLTVQQHLHRIDEWTAADLDQQIADLEEAQVATIETLNSNDALQGLFIDAMARRLRSLAEAADKVRSERELQALRLRDSAVRLASAERLTAVVSAESARETAKNDLREILERYVGSATQASGKIGRS